MIGPRFAHAAEPPPTGGRGPMLHPGVSALTPPAGMRVWLACGRTDMRKGIDGLAMLAQQVLKENPFDGALFAFRGRRGGMVKLLWYDGQGMCLFSKRLERGHFVWPVTETGRVSLTPAQLSMLLEGIDWRMARRERHPDLAG
jgi:transposase